MKKFKNVFLAFAAISVLSLAFVSCSDSDDDSTSDTTQDPTNTVTTTTDSWDLTGTTIIGKSFDGFIWFKKADKDYRVEATTDSSTVLDAKLTTAITIDSQSTTYDKVYNTLKEAITFAGNDNKLTLTLANYQGTGIGKTTVGESVALPSATSGTGLESEPKTLNFKAKSDAGLLIKKDALKIAGVKGKVKLTISWYMASAKSAGERNLEVTVGSDGTPEETGCTASKGDQPDYTVSFDGGEDGKDVFIGASNEILIKSIKIEAQ